MKRILVMTIALVLTAVTASAQWPDKLLNLDINEQFSGQSTLNLKQEIRDQHGSLDFSKLRLQKVALVIKSRKGYANVQLVVGRGQHTSEALTVPGHPSDYYRHDDWSFFYLELVNPRPDARGRWLLDLNGNLRLKNMIVVVDEQAGRARRPRPTPAITPHKPAPRVQAVNAEATLTACYGQRLQMTLSDFKRIGRQGQVDLFQSERYFGITCNEKPKEVLLRITLKVDRNAVRVDSEGNLAAGVPVVGHQCHAAGAECIESSVRLF